MSDIQTFLPAFLSAMWVTFTISIYGSIFGLMLGGVLSLCRAKLRLFNYVYRTYIWLIRGTPFLAQLMIIYFGLPIVGVTLDAVASSILALALYSAAYFAEIIRTAWATIPKGHLEAASTLSIPPFKTFLHIQLPQALVFSLPLIGNQLILVIKESAIASVITVPELTMTTGNIVATNFSYVVPYGLMIICYWILTESVGQLTSTLTHKMTHYTRG